MTTGTSTDGGGDIELSTTAKDGVNTTTETDEDVSSSKEAAVIVASEQANAAALSASATKDDVDVNVHIEIKKPTDDDDHNLRGSMNSVLSQQDLEDKLNSPSTKLKNFLGDWLASTLVGFLVVTYWRSSWTLLDIWFCHQPNDASLADGTTFCLLVPSAEDPDIFQIRTKSAWYCYIIGLISLFGGILCMWLGLWRPQNHSDRVRMMIYNLFHSKEKTSKSLKNILENKHEINNEVSIGRAIMRWCIVYLLGIACVTTWRGIWYLQDSYLLPLTLTDGSSTWGLPIPLISYWVSSLVGAGGCYLLCSGGSLLAPPAIFLLDGPGRNPPPLTVTIVSSYFALKYPAYQTPPTLHKLWYALDSFASFIIVPIFVVFYWRGTWMLLDTYLWAFEPTNLAINKSIGYGLIVTVLCYSVTNESVISKLPIRNLWGLEILGRIRTYILALGTVSFWRCVWYIWDQFLPGPTLASSWIGHVVGIVGLTVLGCFSCITAPPATMGVDVVPSPLAAEDPLFNMLPLEWDTLHLLGIGRQPQQHLHLLQEDSYHPEDMMEEDEGDGAGAAAQFATHKRDRQEQLEEVVTSLKRGDSSSDQLGGSLRISEMRTYFEIQRGDCGSRRNRDDLFQSLTSAGNVSTASSIAFGRKINSQSSLHRNR